MTRLSISLFGTFVVRFDDQVVTGFSYDKVRALLAYLAVESARPIRRERLVGLLWPDLPEIKGANNLRTALYDLRTVIRDRHVVPPFLSITHTTLQVNPDAAVGTDVNDFRARVAALETPANPGSNEPGYAEALVAAADLYSGDFLQGFGVDSNTFEDWMLVQRESLHLQALDVLERLTALYRGRGDHEQALAWARRQVALDPLREQAHRYVMSELAAVGQRAGAVAQYERCRDLLREKLGLEPEAETQALLARIRDGRSEPVSEPPSSLFLRSPDGAREGRPPGGQGVNGEGAPASSLTAGDQQHGVDSASGANALPKLEGSDLPGLVARPPWSPHWVQRAIHDAEELRRQSGAAGGDAALAAAQAALDMARAAGSTGIEALGHLYAGVVLANATGAGFRASLMHFGRALALAQTEHMPHMTNEILRYLGVDLPDEGPEAGQGPLIQALALYRDLGHRVGESRLLRVLALAALERGDLSGARRYGEEGGVLARELGDRREEGALCRMLGTVALFQGQYGESMRCLQTSMSCFREVDAHEDEAATLRTLGALFDRLGAYDRAQQVLARSLRVLPEGSGPAGTMEGWSILGLVLLHTGDDAGAVDSAGKALSLLAALSDGSRRTQYPRLRSAALRVRGRGLARQGQHGDAALAYREAAGVRQQGRWPGISAEARAGLAELALLDEGPGPALAEIEALLPYLEAGNLTGAMDPLYIYWTCYRVLEAADDARSRTVLAQAHRILLARAASIEDEGLRRAYLEGVKVNLEIVAAAAHS